MLILSTSYYTFPYKLVMNLVIDQDNNFCLIRLSILITCLLDNTRSFMVIVVEGWGEKEIFFYQGVLMVKNK